MEIMKAEYDGTIFSLFSILDCVFRENKLPDKIICNADITQPGYDCDHNETLMPQQSLFKLDSVSQWNDKKVLDVTAYKYFESCRKSFSGQKIIKNSGMAYKDILYAWMSELPIEREVIHFAWKIVSADRMHAEKARCDLADINVKKVIDAASKARRESHFLMGILRFSIGANNVPIARCSPDHFILPALANHFMLRFNNSNWAIIDEKRNIALMQTDSKPARLTVFDPAHPWFKEETDSNKENNDDWEKMWKNYHTSINNENRKKPDLQRRFIPVRYWKYLPEFNK